jgi:hypothetical protein
MGMQGAAGGQARRGGLEEPNDRSNRRTGAPRSSRRGGAVHAQSHAVLRLIMRRLTLMRELLELGL